MSTALLQGQQLLGTESLVMDLRGGLDKVLEMCSEKEVSEIDKFAVSLVLNVDDSPSVLAAADLLTIDDNRLLGTDNCERNKILDLTVQSTLLIIKFLVIIGVHLEVMESKLLLDALLELLALLNGQSVCLGNDRHHVDHIRQLLQDNNINGLERVARWLDEKETAVDTGILDVALSLCSELLAQVRGVLILDVLDDGVPTAVVVDKVAVTGSIDNVESESDTVLLNVVRNGLDLSGLADRLVGLEATLRVDQVRSEMVLMSVDLPIPV